jgi:hypothetical protein
MLLDTGANKEALDDLESETLPLVLKGRYLFGDILPH